MAYSNPKTNFGFDLWTPDAPWSRDASARASLGFPFSEIRIIEPVPNVPFGGLWKAFDANGKLLVELPVESLLMIRARLLVAGILVVERVPPSVPISTFR